MTRKQLTLYNILQFPERTFAYGCPIGKDRWISNEAMQIGSLGHKVFHYFLRTTGKIAPNHKALSILENEGMLVEGCLGELYLESASGDLRSRGVAPFAVEESNYHLIKNQIGDWVERIAKQAAAFTAPKLRGLLDGTPEDCDISLKAMFKRGKVEMDGAPICEMERKHMAPIPSEKDAKFNLVTRLDYATYSKERDTLKVGLWEEKVLTGNKKFDTLYDVSLDDFHSDDVLQLEGQTRAIKGSKAVQRAAEGRDIEVSRHLLFLSKDPENFSQIDVPESQAITEYFDERMWQAWEFKNRCYRCVKEGERVNGKYPCGVRLIGSQEIRRFDTR